MQRHPRKPDKKHMAFVAARPCLICRTNVDVVVHHIKMPDSRTGKPISGGTAGRSDDRYTLPLCATHHEMLHRLGESMFWKNMHADACLLALVLYAHSVNDEPEEADRLIEQASYEIQRQRFGT